MELGLGTDVVRRRHAEGLARQVRGAVRFGVHDRLLYATDASLYQVEPIGVVTPADEDDLVAAVRYCDGAGVAMLPRGGGTSLAGQCVNEAVVLDVSPTFDEVGAVDASARTVVAGAGATLSEVNRVVAERGHDLFFAPDPSTARQATVGGCIGNNAAGTRSILYGRTAENLVGMDAVLATGERVRLERGSAARGPERLREIARGVVDLVRRRRELIRERFPKTLRRNAGYALDMILDQIEEAERTDADPLETLDLSKLVCGSEGTLAITSRATLRLHPTPKMRGLGVLGFSKLDRAIESVEPLLELGPSAVELLDDMVVGLARKNIEHRRSVELMPQPADGEPLSAVLYVEFSAEGGAGGKREAEAEIEERFAALRAMAPGLPGSPAIECLSDAGSMKRALELRTAGEPLLHAVPGSRKPLGFVEDNAVPVSRLAEFVRRFRGIVEENGTSAAFYAHASVGVLHVRPLLDLRDDADRARMEHIAVRVADLARELGGVMSGEHGDGRARGPLLERFYGPELMDAFREVKRLFDPRGLLNPGNIVPATPERAPAPATNGSAASRADIASIHDRTRIQPHERAVEPAPVDTYFEYASEGGFGHAVELCNGSGVCRKRTGGTMCPSYMASLDERHSTRGRGNALRLAVTGQLPTGARGKADGEPGDGPRWNDRDTLETLDLCLSCKACKSECPTNVDVATYKAEYLAQGYREAGKIPLWAKVFGRVRTLNRLGSAFAPLSNLVAEFPPARAINNRLLGLSPERKLPGFAPSLFRRLRRAERRGEVVGGNAWRLNEGVDRGAPAVVVFGDCFTAYNEPGIGVSAARLLNAFGYRVVAPDSGCCARSHVSTGLLEEATGVVRRTSERLEAAVRAAGATAVVVCEPSCLSAIKDEWQDLKTDGETRARAARLAAMSFLVDDFLGSKWDEHPRRPRFRPAAGRVLVHGHCHQKALWGIDTTAVFADRVAAGGGDGEPDASGGAPRAERLDTGCCGMAGSFGYADRRFDLSMKIGELGVFPAARSLGPDDVMLAPGTSCRAQVLDGLDARLPHPVEWAVERLDDDGSD